MVYRTPVNKSRRVKWTELGVFTLALRACVRPGPGVHAELLIVGHTLLFLRIRFVVHGL